MMFADYTPRSRHWAFPLMIAAVLAVAGWQPVFGRATSLLLHVVSAIFTAWAGLNLVHQVTLIGRDFYVTVQEWRFKMTANYWAQEVAKMTPEQLKAVRAGRPIFEVIPGESATVYKLFGYEAYDYLLWYILVRSSRERVYPINNFQAGTFHFDSVGDHAIDDNTQAHNVHAWLVWYGFAEWGRGNQSARFVNGYDPDKVLALCNMERDTYGKLE